MQRDWMQVVQLSPFRSLQTKVTLFVIVIVAGVLALSTFLSIRTSERALERDLRENAIALARQFAADIGSWEELNHPVTLQIDIGQLMDNRSSIARVEVYVLAEGVPTFITASDAQVPASPAPEVSQVAREDRPVAVLQRSEGGRQWDVAVPVHLHGVLAGVVRLQVGLEEADQLVDCSKNFLTN
jgi:hypothetical protein